MIGFQQHRHFLALTFRAWHAGTSNMLLRFEDLVAEDSRAATLRNITTFLGVGDVNDNRYVPLPHSALV